MEWTRVAIQTTTFGTEVVMGVLLSAGISGVEIVDPRARANYLEGITRTWDYVDESLLDSNNNQDEAHVIFYVTKDESGATLLKEIQKNLESARLQITEPIGSLNLLTESTNDENWLHEWKKHFKPIEISNVVIVPEWEEWVAPEESQNTKIIFKIDPGTAFGTGQHQTTQLCVQALQQFVKPNDKIIDIGCGSGILSCISLLLGAEFVFACDIDPAGAISATKRNAALNFSETEINKRLEIQAGDILSDSELLGKITQRKYNIVVANIVADVIISLLPLVPTLLESEPHGYFISSGIIEERLGDVLTAFNSSALTVEKIIQLEGWCCVVGRLP